MFRKCILTVIVLASLASIAPDARGQGAVLTYQMLAHQIALTPRISDVFLALSTARGISSLAVTRSILGFPGTAAHSSRPGAYPLDRELEMLLRFSGGEPRLIAAILNDLPADIIIRLEALALGGTEELSAALLEAESWLNDGRLLSEVFHFKKYAAARASGDAFRGLTDEEILKARAADRALIHEFFRGRREALGELSSVGYEALRNAVAIPSRTRSSVQMSALPTVDDISISLARRGDLPARIEYLGSVMALIERTLRPYTATGAFIDINSPEASFLPRTDLTIDFFVYERIVHIARFAGEDMFKVLALETHEFLASNGKLIIPVSNSALVGDLLHDLGQVTVRHAAIEEFLAAYARRSQYPEYMETINNRRTVDAR